MNICPRGDEAAVRVTAPAPVRVGERSGLIEAAVGDRRGDAYRDSRFDFGVAISQLR